MGDVLRKGEEQYRRVNVMVIQDMEDYLIMRGMGVEPKNYRDVIAGMTQEEIKKKFPRDYHPAFRPPELWGHPISELAEHKFRDIANPFKTYNDDRVKKLFELIK